MPSNTNAAMRIIRPAITRFSRTARDYALIDAAPPEDRERIEEAYQDTRKFLEQLIERKLNE